MKRLSSFILLIFIFLTMYADAQTNYAPEYKKVRADWSFRQAHQGDWMPCTIPASVHTALLENEKIDDPYYRDNEDKLQWIEMEDWEFKGSFTATEKDCERKHQELRFEGIDTYAQIYLNDSLILETDNMFRSWTADVTGLLKPGENELHVYFESPTKKVEKEWNDLGYELPGGIRVMSRKAQFHYGWDWGPKFAGCGILQLPELITWDDFIFDDVFFTTKTIDEKEARVMVYYKYRSDVTADVQVFTHDGRAKSIDHRTIYQGVREDSVWFDVQKPKLWWCNGMGEPHLYDFYIEIRKNGQKIERKDVRTGIRTIELVTEKDAAGNSFYFKLNGKPVFMKGANYIPQDMFQDRVEPGQYKKLLDDCVASNMNMLRVWGGGIYEDELFYQLCNARGILVWQDFMYACALYPGHGSFFKTAAREAQEQILRLRQHPCIALWCGNNENNEAWHHWGWQMKFNEEQRKKLWRDYELLFQELLPTYVKNDAGGVPYWESSPKYGRANPKSTKEGDAHYWGVWHDEEPFSVFDKKVPRFMSEFGFQSFPEWRTIRSFTEKGDRELETPVMLLHQKHPRGNALIAEYMKRDYRSPKSFEDFVYVSQLLQAEGMRTGIEAHRRNKPYCMGTLYWQLNDVWPVASWSSIDYYGRWKAMQYYVRDAYSHVAALPHEEDGMLKIYGSSELMEETTATLKVRSINFGGKVLNEFTLPDIKISPDSSKVIWEEKLKTVVKKHKATESVVEITLEDAEGKQLYRRLWYAEPPRKLSLPRPGLSMTTEKTDGGYKITVTGKKLAKNVYLQTEAEGFFEDNYFDLLPEENKTILFKTDAEIENPDQAFRIKHLGETN